MSLPDEITLEDLRDRVEAGAALIDVRTAEEFSGAAGYPCDARHGHIPGAINLPLRELFASPGTPREADAVRAILEARAVDAGGDLIAYCHSGARSATAVAILRRAGLAASNYAGSWHEWAGRADLPVDSG